MLNFGVVLTHEDAVLPIKDQGNVGIDLYCVKDTRFKPVTIIVPSKIAGYPDKVTETDGYTLKPGERYLFSTGIKLNIPTGYAIIFKDRSGNAGRKGLHVLGGVIDSSYTGELLVVLLNTSNEEVTIVNNDRIAQMVVVPDYDSQFIQIEPDQLNKTDRGEKGFGSSGN